MSQAITVIAVIARNRRNRKGKTLPLMNADDADWEDWVIARDLVIRKPKPLKRRGTEEAEKETRSDDPVIAVIEE